MILSSYLNFNGTCEDAFRFYSTVFNGEITAINRYEGSPLEFPENYGQKVMHAEMIFENNRIQGCDILPKDGVFIDTNYKLSLNFMEVFIMDQVFNDLAKGGVVTMPLQDTFWGARYGKLTDRFGIHWMFNCDLN